MKTITTVSTRTGKILRVTETIVLCEMHLTNEQCQQLADTLTGGISDEPIEVS